MRSTFARYLVTFVTIFLFNPQAQCQDAPSRFKIWFNKPAETWNDALPVGNGSLGTMIFGGIDQERLEINEETVWTGEPRWDANPAALKTLPIVRKLLFEGKYKEAEALAQKGILGKSHAGEVELLPALPSEWQKGYIRGLMARDGFEVDIEWENGKLSKAKITSKLGNPLKLIYKVKVILLEKTEKGMNYVFGENLLPID